jgi:bifunctional enzyme CysN/CysC
MSSIPSEQLKIVIVGHVDHGKSTFVGRLFHDTGSLPEGKLEQLQKVAERRGVPFEWANLMDALQSERDQNITIDTAQIWFQTKKRQYVIIDAPGHKEFLKNMITGAANAEAALLLIDANEGIQEQSRRHGYLLNLLGIRQIAVLVNKMDLQGHSQARFEQIEKDYRAFLQGIGVQPKVFIPISAKNGDNIASPSKNMPWWQGPTVLAALDDFKVMDVPDNQPLRFPIQDVYRFDDRRILAGRVEAGKIKVNDRLLFSPGNKTSTVKTIERWSAPARDNATTGESIGITLTEQIFVERGAVAALETAPPYEVDRFKARLFWLGRKPFTKGKMYKLKLATQEAECEIESIEKVIDASTLETISRAHNEIFVGRHEVAELTLRTKRPVAFDAHSEVVATGRFVIVDGFEVSGGGIVAADHYPRRSADSAHKNDTIYWSHGKVTAQQRALRNGHGGCVVWLTGPAGSGKSPIANELERELFNLGKHAYLLDVEKVRQGLCADLPLTTIPGGKEKLRRAGEVARLFADAGVICITAFVSPQRAERDLVRQQFEAGQFIEVYVKAPNPAREMEESGVPYEPPLKPELELDRDKLTVAESVAKILDYLHVQDEETEISI